MPRMKTGVVLAAGVFVTLGASGCVSNAGEPLTANGKTAPATSASPLTATVPVPRPGNAATTQTQIVAVGGFTDQFPGCANTDRVGGQDDASGPVFWG